jgi:hypothetical protein
LDFNLLFRWFVGLGIDDPVWDASSFCHNRDRFLEADVSADFLNGVAGASLVISLRALVFPGGPTTENKRFLTDAGYIYIFKCSNVKRWPRGGRCNDKPGPEPCRGRRPASSR